MYDAAGGAFVFGIFEHACGAITFTQSPVIVSSNLELSWDSRSLSKTYTLLNRKKESIIDFLKIPEYKSRRRSNTLKRNVGSQILDGSTTII